MTVAGSEPQQPSADALARAVKALGHPLRVRALKAFGEATYSPNQLSELLNEPLSNVSYHVRTLVDYGTIELVDTAQRRGATEHFYRANELGRRLIDLLRVLGG